MTVPVPAYPAPLGMLKGKTVVVTAAAGTGIGYAVAKRAAEEGAKVLISDFHERRLGEAADRIAAEVGCERPVTCVCDVTSEEAVLALRDVSLAALGKIDVLINNAGLGGEVSVVDMTDDQWHRVLDVTLTSLFRMTRAFLPSMYANKSGVMVNNASVLGWRAQRGQAHYAAAKAGVMAFTRCSALEAADHGVRINAVAPSLAMHPFLAKVTTEEMLAQLVKTEAYGRPAEVWEVANVMIFLASDLSSYMTGEIVPVSSQKA
jgi:3-oxoacyl-[acyl-carrier protein] reductase